MAPCAIFKPIWFLFSSDQTYIHNHKFSYISFWPIRQAQPTEKKIVKKRVRCRKNSSKERNVTIPRRQQRPHLAYPQTVPFDGGRWSLRYCCSSNGNTHWNGVLDLVFWFSWLYGYALEIHICLPFQRHILFDGDPYNSGMGFAL